MVAEVAEVVCRPSSVEIAVTDHTPGFDLATASPLISPDQESGRGLFIIKSLMDEVTCQRRGERGNTLRLVKRCVRDSQSSEIR